MGALQASLGNCPSLRRAIESVLYMAECTKADEASEKVSYIILLCHSFFHGCQLNSFPFFKLITKKLPQIYLYVLKYYVTEGQRRLEVRSNGDGQNVSLDLYSGRLR